MKIIKQFQVDDMGQWYLLFHDGTMCIAEMLQTEEGVILVPIKKVDLSNLTNK